MDIDWRNQLEGISDAVVFVDEGSSYVTSEDFASALQGTDNYYVIFSREPLHQLPYSVDEIYQFKNSGKRHRMEPVLVDGCPRVERILIPCFACTDQQKHPIRTRWAIRCAGWAG